MGYDVRIGLFRFPNRSLHKAKLHSKKWAGLTFTIKSEPENHILFQKRKL